MPSGEIDIGLAALNLSKEFRADLDVDMYSNAITRLAREVHQIAGDSEDPAAQVEALNTVLFGDNRFAYDESLVGDNKEEHIDELLETKRGTCFSLAVLYVAVAQRLGYKIFGMAAPGHVLGRLFTDGGTYNLDPSLAGMAVKDKSYIKDYGIKANALDSGSYLRAMSNREFAGDLVTMAAKKHLDLGRIDQALHYAKKAVEMNPQSGDCWTNLSFISWYASIMSEGETSNRLFDLSVESDEEASALGFTAMKDTPAWKENYQ